LNAEQLDWEKFFFSGVPAPICALLSFVANNHYLSIS
jgi:CDP-diacylglycerol--serine O-phosphatidyltransferase